MTHTLPALFCAAALMWAVTTLIAVGLDRLARCQATWLEDET